MTTFGGNAPDWILPTADSSTSVTPLHVVPSLVETNDFETFYATNIGPLVGALTATLANPPIAQDAAQEAMLRASQRWEKVHSLHNPMGWCYRVGLNWATSRWRKRC